MHYIAESRRWELKQTLANARFFSLLLEGSTDVGNVDDEAFLAVCSCRSRLLSVLPCDCVCLHMCMCVPVCVCVCVFMCVCSCDRERDLSTLLLTCTSPQWTGSGTGCRRG